MNKLFSNEKGSILVSVVLFMSVTSMMITGVSYLVKNQAIQFKQLQQSYEAKAAIAMSEELLMKKLEEGESVASGEIQFNSATVNIANMDQNKYEFTAQLKDGYTLSKLVRHPVVDEEKGTTEENLSEKSTSKEDKQEENIGEAESVHSDKEKREITPLPKNRTEES